MTRTIQSRMIALAGVGVFAAGAALALLSRRALLDFELVFRASQERLASVVAGSLSEDVLFDEQLLQGAADAPFVNPSDADYGPERRALVTAQRSARLASAVCFASASGDLAPCEPASMLPRVAHTPVQAQVTMAMARMRPTVSPLLLTTDGAAVLIVLPMHADNGAAQGAVVELIDAGDRRLAAKLRSVAMLVDDRGHTMVTADPISAATGAIAVGVSGTPWLVQVAAVSASGESAIGAFRRTSLWVAPAIAAMAMLLAWGIAGSVRRPIDGLVLAAERIAAGNLDAAVPAAPPDEIGRLSSALEEMRVRLKEHNDARAAWSAELEHRVERRTRELQRLTRQVISAQEDERRRVARELHDETSQLVAAIGMRLDAMIGASAEPDRARVLELRTLIDRMHDGLHRLIVNLRPSVLDDLGLAAAIQWLCTQQLPCDTTAVRCELGDLQDVRLPADVEIAVFRIVQEAVTNIARHASADSVLIQGSLDRDALVIDVEDDGRGFEPSTIVTAPDSLLGVGLLGMRERAQVAGGRLTVDSAPGKGTRVRIAVPLTARYEVVA